MRGIQPLPSCPERVKAKEKYHAHGPHAEWKKNPQNSQKNERMGSFKNLIKASCQNLFDKKGLIRFLSRISTFDLFTVKY